MGAKQEMEEGGKDFIPGGGGGMMSQAREVNQKQPLQGLGCPAGGPGLSPGGTGQPRKGAFQNDEIVQTFREVERTNLTTTHCAYNPNCSNQTFNSFSLVWSF